MDDPESAEELIIRRKRQQKQAELPQLQKAAMHCLSMQKAMCADILMAKSNIDHRLFERKEHVVHDHERAAHCIRSD